MNYTISATYTIGILSVKVWGYLDQRSNAALLRRQTPLRPITTTPGLSIVYHASSISWAITSHSRCSHMISTDAKNRYMT
jgi:hypothetical protein